MAKKTSGSAAYWPFHKANCYRNEFADLTAASEPKFARWMRKHQKLAVLKDNEIDRLERASQACTGPSRQDVMDSMYNRLDPRPKGPLYSAEEQRAMHEAEEKCQTQAKLMDSRATIWGDINVPSGLGLDCGRYKWWQNQSYVEALFLIPENVTSKQVKVHMAPSTVEVQIGERIILQGSWYGEIKQEDSTWYIQDGILHMQLLKRNRRGNYANSSTNADTYWKSV
ncbi:hypothetical protein COCOBI_02-3170 [Coccomyxa sp. Obi]|nr:hypothetical protein COCOBI_02-3170 [Coccomyxa sp. Obi]